MPDIAWETARLIMAEFGLGTAAHRVKAEKVASLVAEALRLRGDPEGWQPLTDGRPEKGTLVLVALIRDGVIWRVSDAAFNGLGFYTKTGDSCHWRTHWMPLPPVPGSDHP